jgi:hypothetical protein
MVEIASQKHSLIDLAMALVPRTKLEAVRLVGSTVASDMEKTGHAMEVQYGVDASSKLDPATNKITVSTKFMTRAGTPSSEGQTDDVLRIEAEFRVVYSVDSMDGIEEKHVDAFGRMNGVYNVWPYWREYVQSTTVRLGFPPIVLPLLTVTSLLDLYNQSPVHDAVANTEGK